MEDLSEISASIRAKAEEPVELERMYRRDPVGFTAALNELLALEPKREAWRIWNARLSYSEEKERTEPERRKSLFDREFARMVLFALFCATVVRFSIDFKAFGEHNAYFVFARLLPVALLIGLAFLFWLRHPIKTKRKIALLVTMAAGSIWCFVIPEANIHLKDVPRNDLLLLAMYHVPLFLWSLFGAAYLDRRIMRPEARLGFIEFTGGIAVMSLVILAGGIILVLVAFGLFHLADIKIEDFLLNWVVPYGLLCTPFFAAFLADRLGRTINAILPPVSRIFTFLAAIVLFAYLLSGMSDFLLKALFGKGELLQNKNELILLNLALVLALGLIIFSLSNRPADDNLYFYDKVNVFLIVLALLIDGLALTGAVQWLIVKGISPFRLDALLINMLVVWNLAALLYLHVQAFRKKVGLAAILQYQGKILPVYAAYSAAVVFLFPIIAWMMK